MSVPGVFTLPVTVVRETYVQYTPTELLRGASSLQPEMEAELRAYLDTLVGSGSVTECSVRFSERDGVLTATLHAECLEDIGETVSMTEEEVQQIRWENTARKAGEERTND